MFCETRRAAVVVNDDLFDSEGEKAHHVLVKYLYISRGIGHEAQ